MVKLIIIGLIVLLILFGGLFSYVYFIVFSSPKTPAYNTQIMYGFKDYDDYLQNRTDLAKINDENFIKAAEEAVKKGQYKDRVATAQHSCDVGFEFINKQDYETAIKRYNQAWLLDHTQPCVYAGYGYYLGFTSKDIKVLEQSFQMYEKALSLADASNKVDHMNPWWIYIDYAEILSHCYEVDNTRTDCLDKSLDNLNKSLAIKDTPKAHRALAFANYYKKDYQESWKQVHLAINGGVTVENFGDFLNDLKKEMPDPEDKY